MALGALLALLPLGARAEEPLDLGRESVVHVGRPASDLERTRVVDLEVGRTLTLRTGFGVKRVSVGNPAVLDVVVLSPSELQLVPLAPGGTNVVLWDGSGSPVLVLEAAVGTALSQIERRIRSVTGASDVFVEPAGEGVVLKGTVANPLQVDRAVAIAQAFQGGKAGGVVNALDVGGHQQVMIEVIIAEMQRTLARNLSVDWNTIFRAGGNIFAFQSVLGGVIGLGDKTGDIGTGALEQMLNINDKITLGGTIINRGDFLLDLFIELAHNRGLAKVLAKPTLIARSGQTASFLAGGEVPIPVAQGGAFAGSITIEFKDFGVGVEFAPTVLADDRIHLEVSPEVSEPDFTLGTAVGGVVTPGFITRRASTSVELGDGQSFAIAGLLSDSVRESVNKYPLLGEIPILGALFRSVSFQRNETELVLIVTPRLVKPMRPDQIKLPTDSFVAPNDFEFYLLGALESQASLFGGGKAESEPTAAEPAGLIGPSGPRISSDLEEN